MREQILLWWRASLCAEKALCVKDCTKQIANLEKIRGGNRAVGILKFIIRGRGHIFGRP